MERISLVLPLEIGGSMDQQVSMKVRQDSDISGQY